MDYRKTIETSARCIECKLYLYSVRTSMSQEACGFENYDANGTEKDRTDIRKNKVMRKKMKRNEMYVTESSMEMTR